MVVELEKNGNMLIKTDEEKYYMMLLIQAKHLLLTIMTKNRQSKVYLL